MRDLHCCLSVEVGIIGKHPTEHGNVDRGIQPPQHVIWFDFRSLPFQYTFG